MTKELTCIVCPVGCHLEVDVDNDYAVTGNECPRGVKYAEKELNNPTRTITSTVIIKGAKYDRIPVKTSDEIPKSKIFDVMAKLNAVCLTAPVKIGDVVIENIADTGVNIITTRSM